MQYLYTMKKRYAVLHVELGPVFMFANPHLRLLWDEVVDTCRAEGSQQVLIESRNPLRDMRDDDTVSRGDFIGGLEQPGLRAAFCLYNYPLDGPAREINLFAAANACRSRVFERIEEAVSWIGMSEATHVQEPPIDGKGTLAFMRTGETTRHEGPWASGAMLSRP